jgi:hypothetical protein
LQVSPTISTNNTTKHSKEFLMVSNIKNTSSTTPTSKETSTKHSKEFLMVRT